MSVNTLPDHLHRLEERDEGGPRDVARIYADVTGGLVLPVPRRGEPPRHAADERQESEATC